MTTETMLDRRLRELMAELAAPGDQSAAIDNVISVTRALRPEPRWRALLKERPMRTNSIVIAGSPPLRFGLIFAVIALMACSPRRWSSAPSSCVSRLCHPPTGRPATASLPMPIPATS